MNLKNKLNKIKGKNFESLKDSEVNYYELFTEIFLELYDIESSLEAATQEFTKTLLDEAVVANPDGVYFTVERITGKLVQLHVLKKLANAMGLQKEYDSILEKEMELLYRRGGGGSSSVNKIIVGEKK